MTSSYKAVTGSTRRLLSGANTEGSEPQSVLSVGTDNTQAHTPTMPKSSQPTSPADNSGERLRQQVDLFRVSVKLLEKRGLIRRIKVLSNGGKTVKELRLVLSPAMWTDDLHLRLLSDGSTTVFESIQEPK